MVGLPVVLSSPPPPALFFSKDTPPNAESHGIRGLQAIPVYTFNTMIKAKPLIYKGLQGGCPAVCPAVCPDNVGSRYLFI